MRFTALKVVVCAGAVAAAGSACAQLRIVQYNVAGDARPSLSTVFDAIGAESVNGFAKPIDVLAMQELDHDGSTAADVAALLNGLYGAGLYAAAPIPLDAITTGGGLPGLVYRTTSVSLVEGLAFGDAGLAVTQQPRSSMRYQLRPVGYDAAADFYLYSNHYKAEDGTSDQARRNVEALAVRTNSDALGAAHAIYAGDYNVYRDTEAMYQTLLSPGAGQAEDPIETPGNWSLESAGETFKPVHTQSPTDLPGFIAHGMDDRFDFQLVTSEVRDGEGFDYIGGSYRAFGNNGTHALHGPITTGTGAAPAVLAALAASSDHLPVVADYQLPARMQVQVASAPPSVALGAPASVSVSVQNIVGALTALGGDELDYMLSVTGDLIGGLAAVANPLAAANVHAVTLNTATPGLKTGVINVTALSQGAAGAVFSMPVSFTVGGGAGVVRTTIARDDFDAPLNRVSFVQTPAAGAFTTNTRAFQTFVGAVSTAIPPQLRDNTLTGQAGDSLGVIDGATKTDAWFGVTDTVNPDNPSPDGEGVATWVFDVAGASALEVSIDMAAMGDFEGVGTSRDRFDWTYAMDGGAFQPLFTSSVDENATANYTMASGSVSSGPDPAFMTDRENQTAQLTNVLTTFTSAIPELGSLLTIKLVARMDGAGSSLPGDGSGEAFAFDDIVVTGLVPNYEAADFNLDGFVNDADFAAWRGGFGTASGAAKAAGDADLDGDADGADFLAWQRQAALAAAVAAGIQAPEPAGGFGLLVAALTLATRRRTTSRRAERGATP